MARLSGSQSNAMKANDIIYSIIEEVQHCVINDNCSKNAESALATCMKKTGKYKGKKMEKNQSGEACGNCKRTNHTTKNCYSKGGAKEGQGPRQKKNANKPETVVIAADDDEKDMFAFTCTSDYAAIAETLDVPRSRLGTCQDKVLQTCTVQDHYG